MAQLRASLPPDWTAEDTERVAARAQRLGATRDSLRATLPDNLLTPDDARALEVWWLADERFLAFWCKEVLARVFEDLEPVQSEQDSASARALETAAATKLEFATRIGLLLEFVEQEVKPRVIRLDKGLDLMDQTPVEDVDRFVKLKHQWLKIRTELKRALPHAWHLASAVRSFYAQLSPGLQDWAVEKYGPVHGKSETDFSPLLRVAWPSEAIKELDERAKRHAVYPLEEEQPYARRPSTKDSSGKGSTSPAKKPAGSGKGRATRTATASTATEAPTGSPTNSS